MEQTNSSKTLMINRMESRIVFIRLKVRFIIGDRIFQGKQLEGEML